MSTKHTPGPWTDIGICIVAQVPGERGLTAAVVATVANTAGGWRYACDTASLENAANARLLAAAPDLLDALRRMVESVTGVDQVSAVNEARAAIAKATGVVLPNV